MCDPCLGQVHHLAGVTNINRYYLFYKWTHIIAILVYSLNLFLTATLTFPGIYLAIIGTFSTVVSKVAMTALFLEGGHLVVLPGIQSPNSIWHRWSLLPFWHPFSCLLEHHCHFLVFLISHVSLHLPSVRPLNVGAL